eukprot:403358033
MTLMYEYVMLLPSLKETLIQSQIQAKASTSITQMNQTLLQERIDIISQINSLFEEVFQTPVFIFSDPDNKESAYTMLRVADISVEAVANKLNTSNKLTLIAYDDSITNITTPTTNNHKDSNSSISDTTNVPQNTNNQTSNTDSTDTDSNQTIFIGNNDTTNLTESQNSTSSLDPQNQTANISQTNITDANSSQSSNLNETSPIPQSNATSDNKQNDNETSNSSVNLLESLINISNQTLEVNPNNTLNVTQLPSEISNLTTSTDTATNSSQNFNSTINLSEANSTIIGSENNISKNTDSYQSTNTEISINFTKTILNSTVTQSNDIISVDNSQLTNSSNNETSISTNDTQPQSNETLSEQTRLYQIKLKTTPITKVTSKTVQKTIKLKLMIVILTATALIIIFTSISNNTDNTQSYSINSTNSTYNSNSTTSNVTGNTINQNSIVNTNIPNSNNSTYNNLTDDNQITNNNQSQYDTDTTYNHTKYFNQSTLVSSSQSFDPQNVAIIVSVVIILVLLGIIFFKYGVKKKTVDGKTTWFIRNSWKQLGCLKTKKHINDLESNYNSVGSNTQLGNTQYQNNSQFIVVPDTPSNNTTMFNNQVVNPAYIVVEFDNQSSIEAPNINDITMLDIAARPSQIQHNLKQRQQQIQQKQQMQKNKQQNTQQIKLKGNKTLKQQSSETNNIFIPLSNYDNSPHQSTRKYTNNLASSSSLHFVSVDGKLHPVEQQHIQVDGDTFYHNKTIKNGHNPQVSIDFDNKVMGTERTLRC